MPATLLASTGKVPTFEGKPIVINPDGSWSHERAITVNIGGKVMNIPTMFAVKQVSPQTAVEILRKNGWKDPDNNQPVPTFSSKSEAEKAAQEKEKRLQSVKLSPEQMDALKAQQAQQPAAAEAAPADQKKPGYKTIWDAIGGKVD